MIKASAQPKLKMAEDADGFVRGETLDVIFDLLDEETLDELFNDEIAHAVEEMTSSENNSGEFNCTHCKKKYMTKGGLTRHITKKHDDSVIAETADKIDVPDMLSLVKASQTDLHQNDCYPKALREEIFQHQFRLTDPLKDELIKCYAVLSENGDVEKFFSAFYGNVIQFAIVLVPDLKRPSSTLLLKKLGDKMLNSFKRPQQLAQGRPEAISHKELGALQYLSGYVVHKFLKRARNSPKYKSDVNQAIIRVLGNFIEEEDTSQRLIQTQSRGGLTAVKTEAQKIFEHAEGMFKVHSSSSTVFKIDTKSMTNNLLMNTEVVSLFNTLSEDSGVAIDSEIKDNLLENMLNLYLRVRSFSYAKDVTNKHKFALKKKKSKALRKDIKKAMDKPSIE